MTLEKFCFIAITGGLKAYLLTLASGGMRTVEALAIRLKDIEFGSPTKIRIRKEYAKTRVSRDIYISDEATQYLEQWLDWKYKNGQNSGILTAIKMTLYSRTTAPIPMSFTSRYMRSLRNYLALQEWMNERNGMLKEERILFMHSPCVLKVLSATK